MNKKALGPVIAISLLVIVSVVAVIGFQSWYGTYSSKTFSDVESKDKNQDITIDSIRDGTLFIKNNKQENYSLNTIKIGDTDCQIQENLSLGINSIDISSCLQNTGTNDIVLVTKDNIIEKKLFVKELNIFTPEIKCANVTNGLVGLWHLDDKIYSDRFEGNEVDLTKWTTLRDPIIENGRIKMTTENIPQGVSSINSAGKMYFDGDFDIQIDYDSSSWSGAPGSESWESRVLFKNSNYYFCHVSRNSAGNDYHVSWTTDGGDFNLGTYSAKSTGKIRMIRSGNKLECYYWRSGGWTKYASKTSSNVLGRGHIDISVMNKVSASVITTYFDNFIVNNGEIIEDTSTINNNAYLNTNYDYLGIINSADDSAQMQGSNIAVSYSTNRKEGKYSTQITYPASNTNWYGFRSYFNYGDISNYIKDDTYLEFWLYLEDASLITIGQIELGNTLDTQEIYWDNSDFQKNNPQDGWNLIRLNFSDAAPQGSTPNWASNVDHFRIYLRSTGTNPALILRLDEMKIGSYEFENNFVNNFMNNSYNFDGIDDYINIPHNSQYNLGDMSLSVWIYFNSTENVGTMRAISKDNYLEGGTRKLFFMKTSNGGPGKPNFAVMDNTDIDSTGDSAILTNGWHNLIVTRDAGSNISMYIDGILNSTAANSFSGLIDSTTPITLGAIKQSAYSGEYFKGEMDDVAIYNRVLNYSEIQEIYSLGNLRKPICDP